MSEKKLTALSEQTGYSTIASPSSNLAIRHVTVDDMINWLRLDGFYRGLVGWSTQFSPEEIFGSPSQIQDLPESTKKTAQDAPLEDGNVGLHSALDQATREADQEKHVRRMIQEHRRLIPAAVREVERRLISAGIPMEEVRKMGRSDAASSVFVKLGRLEQVQRPAQPPAARVMIQVVCDIGGMDDEGGLWKMDLHIPRNCLFDEFEDILHRHAYVKGILEGERVKTPEHNNDNYDAGEQGRRKAIEERKPHHQVLQGKYVRHTVWGYRIVGKKDTNVLIENDGRWIALCDQEDFTKLMKVAVRDSSKTALICHVCF